MKSFFWKYLASASLLLLGCAQPLRHAKHDFFSMDTMITVTVVTGKSDRDLEPLWSSIDSLLRFWHTAYGQSNSASSVYALNHRATNSVAVSKQLGAMIADALAFGDSTGGLFDPTILPVKNAWGLGEGDTVHRIPKPDSLAAMLLHVGYKKVSINPGRDTVRFSDSRAAIDAGGFAKGYALIETGRILDRHGFRDYLIVAGDIIARGNRFDGAPWRIGIKHPRANGLLATLPFEKGAIFTSGDYERFWMDGNRRIHHIVSPQTGTSCTGNQSVTIRSDSPIQAKYLSTGLFCLPADSIIRYVETRGLDALVVDSIGIVHVSSKWREKVTLIQ